MHNYVLLVNSNHRIKDVNRVDNRRKNAAFPNAYILIYNEDDNANI